MNILAILTGLILISIIMILHELGHFLTGRLLKFRIEQFSLFMGPVLFEWQKGETRYNIKALPIGASVSFAGEAETLEGQSGEHSYAADDPGLFHNRPRWARALVVAMGPIVNFVTAILVFVILFSWTGAIEPELRTPPPESLAARYEIEPGDRLVSINGQRIRTDLDYSVVFFSHSDDQSLNLEIERANGDKRQIVMEPEIVENRWMVGISARDIGDDQYEVVSVDPRSNQGAPLLQVKDIILSIEGLPYSDSEGIRERVAAKAGGTVSVDIIRDGKNMVIETMPTKLDVYRDPGLILTLSKDFGSVVSHAVNYPWSILKATGHGLGMLFRGELSVRESVAGPIGIVSMVGDVVKQKQPLAEKIQQLLMYLGMLSVAVGFTNLLPIPPFDGNHLVVLGIEGSFRRDLPLQVKKAISYIGIFIVIVLTALVLFVDLGRIFGF
ncbi:MAG TPA: RIP metalloprotease RseP [Clostridiaceae bacterium]|nr:RIP metalloprotease RseP [Clostridiaceae bacterium]